MSRKTILALAAVATLAGTALMTANADAMVLRGPRGGGSISHPGLTRIPRIPRIPIHHVHWHHDHFYFWRLHRHYIVQPVGYSVIGTVQPGPCTCLSKNYTPEGMVVFQDLCTKEMASAPVAGTPEQSSDAQGPTNYAGQTYQDYLKANPRAAQAETKKN